MTLSNLPPGVTDQMIEEHANGPAPVDYAAEEKLEIERLRAEIDEWRAESGPFGVQGPHVQHQIESRRAEIARLQSLPLFWTVAVYLDDLGYGGPEEGGWYYGCGERIDRHDDVKPTFLLSVCDSEDSARARAECVQAVLDTSVNVGRRPISSVLSEGRYNAHVYRGYPPARYPEETPHYE